jgi:hypothetical protein
MHKPHVSAGGRYPALRTLGILYVIGAAGLLAYGLYRIGRTLFSPVGLVGDRVVLALVMFGLTALAVIGALLIAELIKLLIDVEHNTQVAARPARGAADVGGTAASTDAPGAQAAPATELDAESAEAALFRGH